MVLQNRTTSMPKSGWHCKLEKESNFFSGILCFLVNFQDLPNKSSTEELNKVSFSETLKGWSCCCCKDGRVVKNTEKLMTYIGPNLLVG